MTKSKDMILGERVYSAVVQQGETARDIVHLSYDEQIARIAAFGRDNPDEYAEATNLDLYRAFLAYAMREYRLCLGLDERHNAG